MPSFSGGAVFAAGNANDAAGVVSEPASNTGGTITFNAAWPWAPNCTVQGMGATQPITITPSTTTLVWTNATLGAGQRFRYQCDFY